MLQLRCRGHHWVRSICRHHNSYLSQIGSRHNAEACGIGGVLIGEQSQNNGLSFGGSWRKYATLPDAKKRDSEGRPPPQRSLPRLMNFPEILWPSVLKSIKNWIMVQFIIRPYFDPEFSIKDFVFGAKRALQVISAKLVNSEFNSLENLVSSDVIKELKPIVQKLSVAQRRELEIHEGDIYLTFPYQVGVIFDETSENVQKRWVEITMVFHVLRGLTEMRQRGEVIPWNIGTMPEYQDRVFVCNYRFIKEFTIGSHSDWTVNVVNHFKPIDLIRETNED